MQEKTQPISRSHINTVLFRASLQTERLQALLADNDKMCLSDIEPIPLPLEPQIRIKGIVPETATLFKVQGEVKDSPSYLENLACPCLFTICTSIYLSIYVLAVSSSVLP